LPDFHQDGADQEEDGGHDDQDDVAVGGDIKLKNNQLTVQDL
jgi:hypothetical protein